MFPTEIYANRRTILRSRVSSGLVLLLGNNQSPINYDHNVYPFRQDSTFLYFFGVERPHVAAVLDADTGVDVLFGDDTSDDAAIWMGSDSSVAAVAKKGGCDRSQAYSALRDLIHDAISAGRQVHVLPQYRPENSIELSRLLGVNLNDLPAAVSNTLIDAVVSLREIKDAEEVAQLDHAMQITHQMHVAAMRAIFPGAHEYQGVAAMREVIERHGAREAYAPIFTKDGQILHNTSYLNKLQEGDLVVNDYGVNSPLGYATDVTRTFPVSGRFSIEQREIYDALLRVQESAIAALEPGKRFADVHRYAAEGIAEEMREFGFFQGSVQDIVDSGAYALCLPHGLGHQLGLDVHDMESLGEDRVGYDSEVKRSTLFGLSYLRLGKRLREGMVLTIEPGIYFIPTLIAKWRNEKRHAGLIDYQRFEQYSSFGGMRIEDNVVITANGSRVLSAAIPKSRNDIETTMQR